MTYFFVTARQAFSKTCFLVWSALGFAKILLIASTAASQATHFVTSSIKQLFMIYKQDFNNTYISFQLVHIRIKFHKFLLDLSYQWLVQLLNLHIYQWIPYTYFLLLLAECYKTCLRFFQYPPVIILHHHFVKITINVLKLT